MTEEENTEQAIRRIDRNLQEIKNLLRGSPYDEKGLVDEVRQNKKEIRNLSSENIVPRLYKLERHRKRMEKIVGAIIIAGNIMIVMFVFWDGIIKIIGS